MEKYQTLEHPADLKIRSFGRNLADLFSNTLKGMFESVKPEFEKAKKKVVRKIKVSSFDQESLLVNFLSEALYLSDLNNEAYFSAEFSRLGEKKLEGKIFGYKIKTFQKEIKAVTYHGLSIKKINKHWEAVVLFDI